MNTIYPQCLQVYDYVFLDTRTPAVENIHCVGIMVAGTAKCVLSILDIIGNLALLYIQFDFELVNSGMNSFFYRIHQ
jgi:hypothetical protein